MAKRDEVFLSMVSMLLQVMKGKDEQQSPHILFEQPDAETCWICLTSPDFASMPDWRLVFA
jgi:hypothetical protein